MSFPQNMPKPMPKLPPRVAPGGTPGSAAAPAAAPPPRAMPGAPQTPGSASAQPAASGGLLGGLFKRNPASPQPAAAPAPQPSRPAAPALPGRATPAMPGRPIMAAAPSLPGRPAAAAAAPVAAAAPAGIKPQQAAGSATDTQQAPRIDLRTLPPNMVPMVEAIQMYDDLLVEENGYLRACDPKGIEALQPRKQSATKLYNDRLRTLLSDPAGMRGAPPDIRDQVLTLIRCLEARCGENAMLLKANMEATEKVFGVINSAVQEARRREALYTRSGAVHWGPNNSVALNATA